MNWLDEYEAKLEAATPGPWYWHGVKKHHDIALLTTKNGHQTVMDFVRWGMNGCAPRLKVDGVLERVEVLAQPRQAHRPDGEFYSVNHPDAEFIAASPEMVAKLIAAVRFMQDEMLDDILSLVEAQDYSLDDMCYQIRHVIMSGLTKLQSGEFEDDDESIGGDGACKRLRKKNV